MTVCKKPPKSDTSLVMVTHQKERVEWATGRSLEIPAAPSCTSWPCACNSDLILHGLVVSGATKVCN